MMGDTGYDLASMTHAHVTSCVSRHATISQGGARSPSISHHPSSTHSPLV